MQNRPRLFQVTVFPGLSQIWTGQCVRQVIVAAPNAVGALRVAKRAATAAGDPAFRRRGPRARQVGMTLPGVRDGDVLAVETMEPAEPGTVRTRTRLPRIGLRSNKGIK